MSRCLVKSCGLVALLVCAWVCSAAPVAASCGDHVVWGKSLVALPLHTAMPQSALGNVLGEAKPSAPCPCRGKSCQQAPADHAPLPTGTTIVFERDSLLLFELAACGGPDLSSGVWGSPRVAIPHFIANRLLRPPQSAA